MIERFLLQKILSSIENNPAVALLGARQVGKTTLSFEVSKLVPSIYLDLESPEDFAKLSSPETFFSMHQDKLIILDEIQRFPNLFSILRGVIDKNRRQGKKNKQFLLLGSASDDLLKQSSESLAGRINYLELSGLNLYEVLVTNNNHQSLQRKLWLRGGFPESFLAKTDSIAMQWLENIIRTYVERDIAQIGYKIPATRLRRLWSMIAHSQGEVINYSKFATNLEVDAKTVSHYIDILVDLFHIRKLPPFHFNTKKRMVKSPRFYIVDSGICHRLLGISSYDMLLSHPVIGKSFEGFIVENILSILPNYIEAYFYRTAAGAEIDLILRFSNHEIWAIEIKKTTTPQPTKGFFIACEDMNVSNKFIIYTGDDEFIIQNDITITSLANFMTTLIDKIK